MCMADADVILAGCILEKEAWARMGGYMSAGPVDLTIALEDYFPDFALDDQRHPFSRSREPRNPGALLAVESPRGPFRVFVLRSMPGVHRVEALDRSFALRAIEPEVSAEIAVHREPLAAVALVGTLLALAGVVLRRTP